MSAAIGDVVKFFMMQATSLTHEVRTAFADKVADVEYSDSAVMTSEEVVALIHRAESQVLVTLGAELKHIANLAGSLASQLIDQASSRGVSIEPVVNELEEETRMQLMSQYHNQATSIKPLSNKLELKQVQDPQMAQKVENLQVKIASLEAELADKVQNTSQFKILQHMLKTKTTEIEKLESKIEELEKERTKG